MPWWDYFKVGFNNIKMGMCRMQLLKMCCKEKVVAREMEESASPFRSLFKSAHQSVWAAGLLRSERDAVAAAMHKRV